MNSGQVKSQKPKQGTAVSAPYKNSGLNVAFRQGRSDARAGRPARSVREMSTFYAAAYLRGYKGQDYRRGSTGHLKFSGASSLGVRNAPAGRSCQPLAVSR